MKKKVKKEVWDDKASNKEQQQLTHGIFRYFGKLPPTLTRKILSTLKVGQRDNNQYVELMCGSGTGILEAISVGAQATGIDCNPLAILSTKVKTTPLEITTLNRAIKLFSTANISNKIIQKNPPPLIRNINKWFTTKAQEELCAIRDWIETIKEENIQNIFRLTLASSIRPSSNASIRTGRIFHDHDKVAKSPLIEFETRLKKICAAISSLKDQKSFSNPSLHLADARETGLPKDKFHFGLCHPPYFALYRYSSDVTRFELEWLGMGRKEAAEMEIEDGFKTTDASLVEKHVLDMIQVIKEARRIIKKDGSFVIVTADSTLRKERLEIIQPLIIGAKDNGWKLTRHVIRKVHFAQSSYHRSADSEIQRPEDEILYFNAI